MGGSRGVWILLLAAAVSAAATAVPFVEPAAAQDAAVAQALLKSGKAALAKKSYDEALSLLERAVREDPSLIEAVFHRGVAFERKGSKSEALAAYRKYLDRLREKSGESKATPDETALGAQAEKRVASLALGEQELAKLESQFAAHLLAFAKRTAAKDAALALRAVRMVLAAQPEHEDALALLEKLGGSAEDETPDTAASAPRGEGPFAKLKVAEWHDLIERKTFGTNTFEYGPPGFAYDLTGGKVVQPVEHLDLGTKYAYECEFRVTQEHERGWLVGLVIGLRQGDFRSVFAQRAQLVVNSGTLGGGGQGTDLGSQPFKNLDPGSWHRLGVLVDGPNIQVWFDGERVLQVEDAARKDLSGDLALFQQRCRAEWRLLRAGRVQ